MKYKVTLKEPDIYLDDFNMIIDEESETKAAVEAVIRYYRLVKSKLGLDDKDINAIEISNKFKIEEM